MKRTTAAALVLATGIAMCLPARAEPPGPEQVVLDMVKAINERDIGALRKVVAEDVHRHSAATAGVVVENRDQFIDFLKQDFAAVPDSVLTVNLILSSGNMVAAHVTYAGTQKGNWGPFPPSGKRVELPYISILRVEKGQVAEIWVEWDNLNALTQLGHIGALDPGGEEEEGEGHGAHGEHGNEQRPSGFSRESRSEASRPHASKTSMGEERSSMRIHYLEIVSRDVDAQCAALERVHDLTFGTEVADLGQARVADAPDGSLIGVRAPLAEHEGPMVRTYLEVEDISQAVKDAEAAGALIAYPPTRQGDTGTWAIYILGDVQIGLWQR